MPVYRKHRNDPQVDTPRATRSRRRHQENADVSEDSSDIEQWRLFSDAADIESENSTNLSSASLQSSGVSDAILQPIVECELTNNSSSSTTLQQGSSESIVNSERLSPSQLSASTRNDERSSAFQLSGSENAYFERPWMQAVLEADMEQYDDDNSSDDEDSNNDDFYIDHLYNEHDNIHASASRLQEMLNQDETNEVISIPITASIAEILLAVLKFSLVYNLPQSAIADLLKMFNSFFARPFLPDSRYLIDKIFNCKDDLEYHALCPNCKSYIKKYNPEDYQAACMRCDINFSLKDSTYTDFFVIVNPESEICHLLEENHEHYESVVHDRTLNNDTLNEFHAGFLYKQLRNSLPHEKKNSFVTATFNTDGSPVFESSKFSIWPIQIVINELPFKVRSTHPIICGLWFGKDKPNTEIFLTPFINHMNRLSNEGLQYNFRGIMQHIFVYTVCCCVDSVARAPVQGMKQFNAYYGCNWCLHPGYYEAYRRGGSIKYVLLEDLTPMRSDENMVRFMQQNLRTGETVFGVNKPTVCIYFDHGFDLVASFVPDSMHCVDLGIADQFLKYWMDSHGMPYSLSDQEIKTIDELLKLTKVPNKVTRFSRSIRDRRYWKAREWENWVLFYSVSALSCIERFKPYFEHWCLLVQAYFILLQNNISIDEVQLADSLLKRFVAYTELLYSKTAMTFNVHQLLHLAQSVVDWGPLWAHSGFSFESGNGRIVNRIHAAKGVLHQICRYIGMEKQQLVLKNHVTLNHPDSDILRFVNYMEKKDAISTFKTTQARYFGTKHAVPLRWIDDLGLSNESKVYRKMVKGECLYTSCKKLRLRSDNSFARTAGGNFIRIIDFIVDPVNRQEYTICHPVNIADIFEDNVNLPSKKVIHISNASIAIETNTIDKICVHINAGNVHTICTVPNQYSY